MGKLIKIIDTMLGILLAAVIFLWGKILGKSAGKKEVIAEKNKEMAELFRQTLKIDKRWRIKDTIIEFNEETGEVEAVIPIDWERAQNFNPDSPKEIDEIA